MKDINQKVRLLEQEIDRMNEKKEAIKNELKNGNDWMLKESLKQLALKIKQYEKKLQLLKPKNIKLTKAQQNTYDLLLNAEIQPYIIDKDVNLNNSYYYINEDGEEIRFSSTIATASKINLKRRKITQGHTSTLKALEKKGLIKCINVGGLFDVVELEQEANANINIPQLYKYVIELNSHNDYIFAISKEAVNKYVIKHHYPVVNIILSSNQNFKIEYEEF